LCADVLAAIVFNLDIKGAIMFKRFFVILCGVLFSVPVFAQGVLRISAIPDESPTELQRKFSKVADYLGKEVGMKVEYTAVTDYAAVVEGLAAKKIDLAWLGGFTFVQARLRTGNAIPIVQRAEDEKFTSKFIANAASGINGLADLKGRNFSFGSVSSTSGHLMPRFFLLENKINPDKDFKRIAFSGAHDATALQVESGKVEAGVLNASVWDKLVSEKKVDLNKVRVIWTTPPYYDYNWTVRGDLDPAVVKKLTSAFLKLDPKNPQHKELLDLQRASKFIATKPENYKGIEAAARSAGLLK
jgi:phosphonate transport system substrate-binding protein